MTAKSEHYQHGDIECIDALKSALTDNEFIGFCKGNVMKYLWRERYKGGSDDLRKAADYLNWMTEKVVELENDSDEDNLADAPDADLSEGAV